MKKFLKYLSMALVLSLLLVPTFKTKAAATTITNVEVSSNSVKFSWPAYTGGTFSGYRIGVGTNADDANAKITNNTPTGSPDVNTTTWTVNDLQAGTAYYIVVKAVTTPAPTTTVPEPTPTYVDIAVGSIVTNPNVPSNLRQKSWSYNNDKLVVAWDYNGNCSGFELVVTDDDGDQRTVKLDSSKRTYECSTEDVSYLKFKIRAYIDVANSQRKYSDYSETYTTFAQPMIKETEDGFALTVKNGKLKVEWTKVNEASAGYEIWVSTKKNTGYKKVKTISSKSTTKATIAKFNGKKFSAGKAYYVCVIGRRRVNNKIDKSSSTYVGYYRNGESFITKKKDEIR